MWPSGLKALGRHVQWSVMRSVAGVQTSAWVHPPTKDNSYAHDEQGDNPGHEKEGSIVSSINCDHS